MNLVDAAIGGMGLAQLPVSLVREAVDKGLLTPVLESFSTVGVEVNAVWPQQAHLSPRLRYMVDELVRYAALGRFD